MNIPPLRTEVDAPAPDAEPAFRLLGHGLADANESAELTPGQRNELLDLEAWGAILSTYGRTIRVAVALTDAQGRVLGKIHNPQPVWTMVHDAARGPATGCPFCIAGPTVCTAVADSFRSGTAVMAHDQAGLAHVAVPLVLGKQHLGAIIAGQVFDRYPEPLSLRRVAKDAGISAQDLWMVARKQRPVSTAILQSSGDLLCALGHAFIRQRFAAILEAELADTNGQFRLLVETVRGYALFTTDLEGRVSGWNAGAERMLGYAAAEIVGRNFSCMFAPEDVENRVPETHLRDARLAGRRECDGMRFRADRQPFLAHVEITSLAENAGGVRGFALIMQDITERNRIAEALNEARQDRSRLQDRFLSHISHELRTPLTAIYFFTTNVLDGLMGELTPTQSEHLTLALDNVKQLKDMVNDLLDIAQIEAHKLSVEPQQANAVRLIADALHTCETNAAAKNISLRSDAAPNVPFLWADPARLRQVLINLIDNGIKFSPERGIVTVASRLVAEDHGLLRVSVSDTGLGITPANQEIIFDRLAQVQGGAEASRRGLGLGLFISKELVSQQGGRIWVESELGHGSTFFFTVPVFSLAKQCARVLTIQNLAGGCVTLIKIDIVPADGSKRVSLLADVRAALGRSIRVGPDLLLPSMGVAEPLGPEFIVACTGASGAELIGARIKRELHNLPDATFTATVSTTMLFVSPDDSMRTQNLASRIEGLVTHFLSGKTLQ